jgi:hypothetical protein
MIRSAMLPSPRRVSPFLVVVLALGLAALVGPVCARAQDKKPEAKERIEYEKKTVINFDDDTIQGDLTRPDGEYVEARKKVGHQSLIKVRENWREKVKQGAAEL